ncbi:MAG: hypothetical protein ACAH95_02865 [Fimbriimonas sp.]
MRTRGFTLTDCLVSALILGLCISGLAGLWVFCLNQVQNSRELTIAGQIARAEVEQAKVYGYPNLPRGMYRLTSGDSIWTGAYNRAGNDGRGAWSRNGETYYNTAGDICSATDSKAMFLSTAELRDSDIAVNEDGSDYELGFTSRRTLIVTVSKLPTRKPILRMSTEFVRGGL